MARTSLAVSAGYVNTFKFMLWIIQRIANGNRIMQVCFIGCTTNPGKHWKLLIKIFDRFFVSHFETKIEQPF